MSNQRSYITTAIPYVNGDPHLGFALECVQADVLARHRRLRRQEVRFLSGTDDHALKNVEAASAAGVPVAQFVDAKAERFAALRGRLELSNDDFIRTSRDARHRPGVERLWRACAQRGRNSSPLRSSVWFDALCNYISALDYGIEGELYNQWWGCSDERVHVIGKGIVRFHAVYWPAILLSAGEPLPTVIFVHDYLTVDGEKLSKSFSVTHDPADLAARYGSAALRWWFLRDVPRTGDTDFREERLAERANELADGLGNVVNRTIALVARDRPNGVAQSEPRKGPSLTLQAVVHRTPRAIDDAFSRYDVRGAAAAFWSLVEAANRHVAETRPWERAEGETEGDAGSYRDEALRVLVDACHTLARESKPFLPAASDRIERALVACDPNLGRQLFPKAV
jgi:methionyl-tRNA synthetase